MRLSARARLRRGPPRAGAVFMTARSRNRSHSSHGAYFLDGVGGWEDAFPGMNRRDCSALTWVEAIVALGIVCVLAAMIFPRIVMAHARSPASETLVRMRHLHLATQTMALDGATTGETNLNWPGNTGGTYSNWMTNLVPAYLSTNDLRMLMSAPQVSVPRSHLPAMKETAFLVYAVRNEDSTNSVFLTTANFTNTPAGGMSLNSRTKPYGNRNFVVMRRGGNGDILQPKDAGNPARVGSFAPLCR